MRSIYNIIYRLLILAILAFFVGSVVGALQSGKLTILLSADSATVMVAIAEALIALAICVEVAIEGSTFLLKCE